LIAGLAAEPSRRSSGDVSPAAPTNVSPVDPEDVSPTPAADVSIADPGDPSSPVLGHTSIGDVEPSTFHRDF